MSGSRDRMDPFVGLVGWLFADVLLGLAMLYFAIGTTASPGPRPTPTFAPPTETSGELPTETPKPTATPLPAASPTPTPVVQQCIGKETMTKEIFSFDLPLVRGGSAVDWGSGFGDDLSGLTSARRDYLEKFGAEVENRFKNVQAGYDAGLVLAFGGEKDSSGGTEFARKLEAGVKRSARFRNATYEPFLERRLEPGQLQVWVYFYRDCTGTS